MSAVPPEVVVVVGPSLPDVTVQVAPPLPDVVVESAEVGLVGPRGPVGPPGPATPGDLAAINAHIADATPHPAYDDLPSLTLLLENGLI
jgi:hypothetical protein